MSLWNTNTPPILYPDAVATPNGWADPITGETLVCISGLSTYKGINADLAKVMIQGNKKVFAYQDYIVLEAAFSQPVTYSGSPTIASVINGNARTFAAFTDATNLLSRTSDKVTSITIGSGGSGYAVGEVLSFTGGGGSSASAVVSSVSGGVINGINVLDGGSNYTSAPTVGVGTFVGSVASAVAQITYNGTTNVISSVTVESSGSGYTSAPTVVLSGDVGNSDGSLTAVLSSTGTIESIVVGGSGTGYTDGDALVFTGGSGSGADAIIHVTSGNITSVTMLRNGDGYSSAPTMVPATSGGSGNTFTATIGKRVKSITISAAGTGFTVAPTLSFSGGVTTGSGASLTAVLGTIANGSGTNRILFRYQVALSESGNIPSVTVGGTGTGYTNADPVVFTGGGGTGAVGTLVVTSGNITGVTMTAAGSGYTSAPTAAPTTGGGTGQTLTPVFSPATSNIAFTSPVGGGATWLTSTSGSGTAATATANVVQGITDTTITAIGSGYTSVPTVTFSAGGGTGATGIAVLDNGVNTATPVIAGVGYRSAPAVTLSVDVGNSDATVTAVLSAAGIICDVTVGGSLSSGTYTDAAAVTVNNTGTNGTGFAATLKVTTGDITGVTITNVGSGYTSVPVLTAPTGVGVGVGRTLTAILGKSVASYTVVAGTHFLVAPTLTVAAPTATAGGTSLGGGVVVRTTATATATLKALQTVRSITITAPGSGYTGGATVAITGGGGSGATATSAKSGVIGSVTITNPGSGYWMVPTVGFSAGAAAATATVDRGTITAITMTNYGSSYVSVPTVSFTPVAETPTTTFLTAAIPTSFSIDSVKPTITSVAINSTQFGDSSSQLAFETNDFFTISVTCSKPVYVVGVPTIALTSDENVTTANYFNGSGTPTLHFTYQVQGTDESIAGEVSTGSVIVLAGGSTILDAPGNPLVLTFTPADVSAVTFN